MRQQMTMAKHRASLSALRGRTKLCATFAFAFMSLALSAPATTSTNSAPRSTPPATPREFFNAGTQEFAQGKLREAESFLEIALASQNERIQKPALYNLGHVRFSQGVEELKKGPSAGESAARTQRAMEQGEEAIRTADDALASNDVEKMVAAYLHGRGKRREIKAARETVLEALKAHQATLAKWERSTGDFKSAVELEPSQNDARLNAEIVDRRIAQLVDSLRLMQQNMGKCNGMCDKLGSKLKQLRGRIPGNQMPPGAGEEDEDEDAPLGPPKDQKETVSKEGKEMLLSPEQAGWLLEGYKLDNERRLPMSQEKPGQPKQRSQKTW